MVAFVDSIEEPARSRIWLYDLARGGRTPWSSEEQPWNPVWSPDGSRIAWSAQRGTEYVIAVRGVYGGPEQVLARSPVRLYLNQFSHDGKWLLMGTGNSNSLLPVEPSSGGKKDIPLLGSPVRMGVALSCDERWMTYSIIELERQVVYVESMPASLGGPPQLRRWRVSTHGGRDPVWRTDGKEIFFIDDALDLTAVAFDQKAGPGVPRPLFHIRTDEVFGGRAVRGYDISADGKFLIPEPDDEAAAVPITVIVNWPALVKK